MVWAHSGPGFDALRAHIDKAYMAGNYKEQWRNLPEIPMTSEIWSATDESSNVRPMQERWNEYQMEAPYSKSLPHNNIKGPWESKAAYLGAHYQILREDEIAPLRKSVADVKARPDMMDDNETHVYTHVTFKGILCSLLGPAFRIEFSTERAGVQIRWEQSKRLIQGSIVAISPHKDAFRTTCKVAVVAARPLVGGVDQNPPQIDIFWGDNNDMVFDPDEYYMMVEARTGFFEASRHMLVAIQKLMNERFPLANHIVDLDPNVEAPKYVNDHSIYDLSALLPPDEAARLMKSGETLEERLQNVEVLQDFPDIPESGMDPSQLLAFRNMMNKKVAIVQGPPGTGKTFVSVSALKVMISNLQPGEPPIIVSAQTNHALDQLLNHVLHFEPNIVRLGGRCDKSNLVILKKTLFELKQTNSKVPGMYSGLKIAQTRLQGETIAIGNILAPLCTKGLVAAKIFLDAGVIDQDHYDSLYKDDWGGDGIDHEGIEAWLKADQLDPIKRTPLNDTTLPLEEGEVEQEIVAALEKEARDGRDPDKDGLSGTYIPFTRTHTGRNTGKADVEYRKLLQKHKDLQGIRTADRGGLYRYLLKQLDRKLRKLMKLGFESYNNAADNLRLTKWALNAYFIRITGVKLVGCTTTGLSKYRGLLAAVQPRTLLIEEAAETKEGTIIAGMIETLQHLILVGDHQQLQANCNIKALEDAPYHMNISMFERLVRNSIGYVMLNKQRRMVPNIRKLLTIEPEPFYENLQDHHSVLDREGNRPHVPGMGERDVHFFHHTWPEARNSDSSRYNPDEAQFIAGVFKHLVYNGTDASKITVLTFYNGQRKRIVQELKAMPGLNNISYFNVFTVDSFQGEENDVILLSLVRSNEHLGIGFLDNKNRLVVALSRARRGLYIYGNAVTLTAQEGSDSTFGRDPLWNTLIQHMKEREQFVFEAGFPITCVRHGTTVEMTEPQDLVLSAGGCRAKCQAVLPCGHLCQYTCHPFPESEVFCKEACIKKLPCGHGCSRFCSEPCTCDKCSPVVTEPEDWYPTQNNTVGPYTASDIRSDPEYAWRVPRMSLEAHSNSSISTDHGSSPERNEGGKDNKREARGSRGGRSSDRGGSFGRGSRGSAHPSGGREDRGGRSDPFDNGLDRAQNSAMSHPPVPLDRGENSTMMNNPGQYHPSSEPPISDRLPTTHPLDDPKLVAGWRTWDAEKADRESKEEHRLNQNKKSGVNGSAVVYKETYVPAIINEKGIRVVNEQRSVKTLVAANSRNKGQTRIAPQLNPTAKPFESTTKSITTVRNSPKNPDSGSSPSKKREPIENPAPTLHSDRQSTDCRTPARPAQDAPKKPSFVPEQEQSNGLATPEQNPTNTIPATPEHKASDITSNMMTMSILDLSPVSPRAPEEAERMASLRTPIKKPNNDFGGEKPSGIKVMGVEQSPPSPAKRPNNEITGEKLSRIKVMEVEQPPPSPAAVQKPEVLGDLIDFSEPAVQISIDNRLIPQRFSMQDMEDLF